MCVWKLHILPLPDIYVSWKDFQRPRRPVWAFSMTLAGIPPGTVDSVLTHSCHNPYSGVPHTFSTDFCQILAEITHNSAVTHSFLGPPRVWVMTELTVFTSRKSGSKIAVRYFGTLAVVVWFLAQMPSWNIQTYSVSFSNTLRWNEAQSSTRLDVWCDTRHMMATKLSAIPHLLVLKWVCGNWVDRTHLYSFSYTLNYIPDFIKILRGLQREQWLGGR